MSANVLPLGPIVADVAGKELTAEDKELLQHPLIGGVVLFSRNYQSNAQLIALVKQIRALRTPELLITVDHEGGVVQRFKEGFTLLPTMASFGELYQADPTKALIAAKAAGYTMASELKAHGIDLSFAPVLDLDKGCSRVLKGGRAIAADPQVVTAVAKAYVAGMRTAGMPAIGKHFPGHGSVVIDSHVGLPVDPRPFTEIEQEDLIPFKELIATGLEGVMPAHIIYSKVDDKPASLSAYWLQTILRQQLAFTGIVFSDCLSMSAASNVLPSPVERVAQALRAGCDMALLCNDRDALAAVLESLAYQPADNRLLPQRISKILSI